MITGYQKIPNWTIHSGSIRKATLNSSPKYAFFNGSLLSEARWPENGSTIKNVQGTRTSLSSPNLVGIESLVGSRVVVQNTAWSFETRTVVSHNGGQITLNSPLSVDPQNYGWGFWFIGKLSFLTSPGEWYYDSSSKTIYVNSNEPQNIDFVTRDVLWYTSYNGVGQVRTNEKFFGASSAAVRIECGTNNGLDRCEIGNSFVGVRITHNPGIVPSSGNYVTNCIINNCYESAINSLSERALISGNTFSNIGVVPGLGTDTWGYTALNSSSGKDNVISYNHMSNLGYIGIGASKNDHIHHNIILDWCMTLNDGGVIALDHSSDMVIEHNTMIITKSTTFPTCPQEWHGCALRRKGIYKGENSIQRLKVRNNIVVNAQGPGYFGDNSLDSTGDEITRNVFVNCNEGYSHSDWGNRNQGGGSKPFYDHSVTNNVIFVKPGSIVSRHINANYPTIDYGVSDNNIIYCDDQNAKLFFRNGTGYTLSEWRSLTGKELNTIIRPYEDPVILTNDTRSEKNFTISNGYMDPWGTKYGTSITLKPFESLVLVKSNSNYDPPVGGGIRDCSSSFTDWQCEKLPNGSEVCRRTETRTCVPITLPLKVLSSYNFSSGTTRTIRSVVGQPIVQSITSLRFTRLSSGILTNSNSASTYNVEWKGVRNLKINEFIWTGDMNYRMIAGTTESIGYRGIQVWPDGSIIDTRSDKNIIISPEGTVKQGVSINLDLIFDSMDIRFFGASPGQSNSWVGSMSEMVLLG